MRFSVEKIKRALFLKEDGEEQLSDREKEKIKQDAESKGLVSLGFGNYGKKQGEPATHTVKNGKLLPVGDEDGEDQQDTQGPQGPPPEASASVDDVLDTINGDDETQGDDAGGTQDTDGQDNNTNDSADDKSHNYQGRIDQNREKIEKFREMRNNISSEDDLNEYENYLMDAIEKNTETIGDGLSELGEIEKSFDEKEPIYNFTSQAYDGAGHRLSMISLAARYPDGNTSDFRVERMKKRCEDKDPKYVRDCENYSPYDEPTPQDIEAFKKLQKNQQQSLIDLGLVDEDGMVTVYRGMGELGENGPVDYKGSAVDSWSMSPRVAWAYSEAYDSKNMLKAKVPLDRVIMAAAASTESQFDYRSEFEVTIDSIGLDNVESVDSSGDMKKIMENTMAKTKMRIIKKNGKYKIIKESKGIPVDINNDKDTDWLRSNRKEKEQVEESALTEDDAPPELSDADRKKIKGLEWKGQGWGPKGKKGITYKRDDNGKVVPVDKKDGDSDNQGQVGGPKNKFKGDDEKGQKAGDAALSAIDGDDATDDDSTEEVSEADAKAIEEIRKLLPPEVNEADPSIARALHYGYNKAPKGCKGNQCLWTPAPGNDSSLLNETMSMIGIEILRENPKMTDDQLMQAIEEKFGKTEAWKSKKVSKENKRITIEAARTKYEMIEESKRNAGFGEDAEHKNYYGTNVSLKNQHDAIMEHTGPFFGGNGEKITSIPTDVETRMYMEDYTDPQTGKKLTEQEINKMLKNPKNPEVIKRFLALSAYNGGGGGNPSDTATIITDGDKMMFTAFSDKTSLGDQQANSTPRKLLSNFFSTMRILKGEGYEFDEKQEKQMADIIKKGGQNFERAEKELSKAIAAPFGVLSNLMKDKNASKKTVDIFNTVFSASSGRKKLIKARLESIPEKPLVNKTQAQTLEESGISPAPTWEDYLKQSGWDGKSKITDDLKKAAILACAADDRTVKIVNDEGEEETTSVGMMLNSKDMQGYLDQVVDGVKAAAESGKIKLSDEEKEIVVNKDRNVEKSRQESINALQEMHNQLNKFKAEKDGEDRGFGDVLMARDMAKALHLGMIDPKEAPGLFKFGSVAIVAGKHKTSPEKMRECLGGTDNVDDLTRNMQTRLPEKSGPQLPSGMHESEVSRSRDKLAENEEGKNLYIVNGEYAWLNENPKEKDVKGPLGAITGRKVFAYVLDKDGNEINVGEMSMRTKGGTNLQTTYIFAKSLKDCLEGKSNSANEQIEMPDYLLRMLERL